MMQNLLQSFEPSLGLMELYVDLLQLSTGIVQFGGYQDFAGTSASTPEVAGCVALLKHAMPGEQGTSTCGLCCSGSPQRLSSKDALVAASRATGCSICQILPGGQQTYT